jgi:hypothetical protein
MSLSDAMLADVLLRYLDENEEFERHVLERAETTNDWAYITLKGDEPHKRLVLRFVQKDMGGGTLSERVYAIKIETIDKPPRGRIAV